MIALLAVAWLAAAPTPAASGTPSVAPTTGASKASDETAKAAARELGLGARPLYYDRAITAADLKIRSMREFALLRNTIYARAGNVFRKEWLRKYFAAQPWYRGGGLDDKKLSDLDRTNADAIARFEVSITRKDLEHRRYCLTSMATAEADPDCDDVPGWQDNAYAMNVENSLIDAELGNSRRADASPLEDPSRLDKLITTEDLSNFSRRDLRLLRNTIYARHGRPFKSSLLQDYFARIEWYKVDPNYSDARLTKIDKQNIKIIQSVETAAGGPMTDDEQYKELLSAA